MSKSLIAAVYVASGCLLAGCSPLQSVSHLAGNNSGSLESRLALARLCEKHDDLQRASSIYEEVLQTDSNSVASRHRMALIAIRKGDAQSARNWFEEALNLDPRNPKLHNDFGYACYLQDQFDESEQHLKRALELQPDMRSAWNNLGLLYGQSEKFDAAKNAFSRGQTKATDLHCNMAYVYAQHGLYDQARDEYQAALELDADCMAAAEGLLQVCKHIQGSEPVTVLATYRTPAAEIPNSDGDVQPDTAATDQAVGEPNPEQLPSSDITSLKAPQSGLPAFDETQED